MSLELEGDCMKRCDKKRSRQSKGFTIVEILAVVVILGILAGVAVPMVYRYVDKSKKQSYETMESTVYAGAKNYVLEQNMSLNSCASGYTDIETIGDNFLQDLQYVERLVDPNDKSKQCVYNVYGCEETEAAGDALATYKYKIELKCLDYTGCIVFHEDGTRVDCEMPNDETRGPDCGEQTPSINSWSNVDKLDIKLQCVDTTSGGCEKKVYTYTFTEEKAHQDVVIKDVFGNSTTCSINTYIDRTAPSKPVIDNPYENVWANKNYKIKVSSVDSLSGIKYFEYRYPNSSNEAERNWTQWENSSKSKGDSTPFTTTPFSRERSEYVEIRACDYAGNCSEASRSMVKIDKTAPTCSISRNIASPNGSNNWYVSNVVLNMATTDNTSGIVTAVKSPVSYELTTSSTPVYAKMNLSVTQTDTKGVTWNGYIRDEAGNASTCSSGSFKVDTVAPTFTLSANSSNILLTNPSDAISGVDVNSYYWNTGATGTSISLSNGTFTVSLADYAGNKRQASIKIFGTIDVNCSSCHTGSDNTYSCCKHHGKKCSCNTVCPSSGSMGCGYSCDGKDCVSVSYSYPCDKWGTCGENTCAYGCDKGCDNGTKIDESHCYRVS